MKDSRLRFAAGFALAALAAAAFAGSPRLAGLHPFQNQSNAPAQSTQSPDRSDAALPRGKKLVLKDGTFHMVREYKMDGDRVRYYSVERSQWEEIPREMVDWPATEQAEAAKKQTDATLAAKVAAEESARKAVFVNVDASVEVAPGVFLPDNEGVFALDGKTVFALAQGETDVKLDKSQVVKQILIPIPIIPSRHSISLLGEHAKVRSTNAQLEFYVRSKSAQAPEIFLIHARVHGGNRRIENIDRLFGGEMARRDTISVEHWELVKGVTRLTLGAPLVPGEYAIAEIARSSEDDLYVWDFGIDPTATAK